MTLLNLHVVLFLFLVTRWAAARPQLLASREVEERPHVSILKQINQINDDGSYTYGFEAADGSFRVETRDVHGFVKGKYGYVDDNGEIKMVDYVAGKPGFSPKGEHLPVLPRVPVSDNTDDEFGTDEDWESVDADEDGMPDPPRPLSERKQKIARPSPAVAPAPVSAPVFRPSQPAIETPVPAPLRQPQQVVAQPPQAIPQQRFGPVPFQPQFAIPAGARPFNSRPFPVPLAFQQQNFQPVPPTEFRRSP